MRTFLFVLLCGMAAMGQIRDHALSNSDPYILTQQGHECDGAIVFRGHSKKISEIFPDECAGLNDPIVCPDGKPGTKATCIGGKDALEREPLSVSAIQESHEEEYGNMDWCNSCDNGNCTAMACDPHVKHKVAEWVCKDRRRVLLTSEDGKGHHCVLFEESK